MTDNQTKIDEAKEKAAQAWAKWVVAKHASKAAYFAFRKLGESGYNDTVAYKRYEKACEERDREYAEAIDAEEEIWRAESYEEWDKAFDAKERAYRAAVGV